MLYLKGELSFCESGPTFGIVDAIIPVATGGCRGAPPVVPTGFVPVIINTNCVARIFVQIAWVVIYPGRIIVRDMNVAVRLRSCSVKPIPEASSPCTIQKKVKFST